MTKSSLSQTEVARRSERKAFLEEERARQVQQRVVDERERIASTAAKTARLRRLREAREDAQREIEAASVAAQKPKGESKKAESRPAKRKVRRPA